MISNYNLREETSIALPTTILPFIVSIQIGKRASSNYQARDDLCDFFPRFNLATKRVIGRDDNDTLPWARCSENVN